MKWVKLFFLLKERKNIKNAFQKMVFYCSTLSAPISRCINVLSTQQREKMCFLTRIINFSHLHHILLKNHSLLGRMHNENTPKYFATKTKTPLLGVKSFFYFHFRPLYYYVRGSGNYRKKWPQDVLSFSWMDNLWLSSIPSASYFVCCCIVNDETKA